MQGALILKAGKERPIIQRHPWVFSGAVAQVLGDPHNGDVVDVHDAQRRWLARGLFSAESQIRARLLSWDAHVAVDHALLRERLERAIRGRAAYALTGPGKRAARLVHAESDGLPGLIVDSYAGFLVLQVLTFGMARRRDEIVELLVELLAPPGIYERSDAEMCQKEGFLAQEGLLWGRQPVGLVVDEEGVRFAVDLRAGQKTGLYLDQRENRHAVAGYCADAAVLDCFCYTGGFSMHAAGKGACSITAVDSSAQALEALLENAALNGFKTPTETEAGDVFRVLRRYRAEQRHWDVIVLDPPKFVQHQGQIQRAARGYKDINLLAMQLLRPGGILATFSCSGLVSADLFQKIVFGAALDAGRDVQIIERLSQAPDHPVALTFPEGEYLKGLICRVW